MSESNLSGNNLYVSSKERKPKLTLWKKVNGDVDAASLPVCENDDEDQNTTSTG